LPRETRILDAYARGVSTGEFDSVSAAARACYDRLRLSHLGHTRRTSGATYAAVRLRVKGARFHALNTFWTPEEDRVIKRHIRALLRNRHGTINQAVSASVSEFERLRREHPERNWGPVPRGRAAIKARLSKLLKPAGWSQRFFRLAPAERAIYNRYARALARGDYAADVRRAEADCHRELLVLARRNRTASPKPTRTLTSVHDHLGRCARKLGWSWHEHIWQPEERRVMDRHVLELVGPNPQPLQRTARACWNELRELRRRSRTRGLHSPCRARTRLTIENYLTRLAAKAGRSVYAHWSPSEIAVAERYARDVLDGRYPTVTAAAGPCLRELADLRPQACTYQSSQSSYARNRTLISAANRIDKLAYRLERGWPCREWTAAENKVCRDWVRWYGRYRGVHRVAPLRTAAEGLQDDLAKMRNRRSVNACKSRVWSEWWRQHGRT
jgi:hypothetical protein